MKIELYPLMNNTSSNKTLRIIAFALMGLVLIKPVQAEDVDREKDHEELRTLRKEMVAAMQEKDIERLAACFTPTFSFTSSDQTTVTNKEGLQTYYEKLFKDESSPLKDIQVVAEADVETIFTGPGAGYVYGKGTDTFTLKDGSSVSVNNRWTAMVTKNEGEWKVAAAHVGVNFYNNSVIDKLGGFNKLVLAVAVIVSLLLGALIGRKTKG